MCVSIRAGIGSINNNLPRQLLLRDENSAADALYLWSSYSSFSMIVTGFDIILGGLKLCQSVVDFTALGE